MLIEDVPGVGKTSLVRSFAQSLGLSHRRLQFTPDLLPTDVTGFNYYETTEHAFVLRRGPVFTNILLADEINRTSPKTQSSLLEAMEERQVSLDGEIHPLPDPFMVMATQNPIEYEGTFPLPEAQLDRFLLKITLGYPPRQAELDVLRREGPGQRAPDVPKLVSPEEIAQEAHASQKLELAAKVAEYALDVVEATRRHPHLLLGVSPRGSIAWVRAARALAYLQGDEAVLPDHLRSMAPAVLTHRLVLRPEHALSGEARDDLLKEILEDVPLPLEGVR